jgi:hypothetical protein
MNQALYAHTNNKRKKKDRKKKIKVLQLEKKNRKAATVQIVRIGK